jgi:uncharacterized protein
MLERYIAGRLESAPGPVVHFEWHGGEPTLLGLDYFRNIVRLQRAHLRPGQKLTNGLQTNGTLIDGSWAAFLAKEGFSVGLSLDGPAKLHDEWRKGLDGRGTHSLVLRAWRLLKARGVFVNLLCVIHVRNAAEPDAVYDFFRSLGASYLQFLPLVAAAGNPGSHQAAADAESIGDFLCRIFDRWIGENLGRMVIQNIDEALRPSYGQPHSLCIHRETCGDVAVLERDGSFYACDHFVDEEHLIGNLLERGLGDLGSDPRLLAFGEAKRDTLPRACRECEYLAWCNGGCPKDRSPPVPGEEPGLNMLCAAYKRFFAHAKPELDRLAAHLKAGLPLRDFAAMET